MTHRGRNLAIIIVVLVIFYFVTPFRTGDSVSLNVKEGVLTVAGAEDFSFALDISQIIRMELTALTEAGLATEDGGETRFLYWGVWENDLWGQYTLCASKQFNTIILITVADGQYFAFNYENNSTTEEMYQALLEYLAEEIE